MENWKDFYIIREFEKISAALYFLNFKKAYLFVIKFKCGFNGAETFYVNVYTLADRIVKRIKFACVCVNLVFSYGLGRQNLQAGENSFETFGDIIRVKEFFFPLKD